MVMDEKADDEIDVAVNRALFDPACQRLNEWALIGPVQRAALESFAERLLSAERERWEHLVRQALDVMENHRSEHAQSRIAGLVYGLRQCLPEYGPNARTNRPV